MIEPINVVTRGLFCGTIGIITRGFFCETIEIPVVAPTVPDLPVKKIPANLKKDEEEVLLALRAYLKAREIRRAQRQRSGRL